jgi:UDP-N-acetylmuramoyl-tripeptide--D-alanyl-D-alanine ligase
MGATKVGQIKACTDIVHPKYGIITKIGEAHLESYGSKKNIENTKFELIESLPSDGLAILNGDDEIQMNHKIQNKVKVMTVGINNPDVDARAINIKCTYKGTEFDVVFKGDKNKYHFESVLLGNNNVYNLLTGILLGKYLGINIEQLELGVRNVRPVEHRLELKKLGNFYQIDDAYNSNPVGAKSALDVLDMMDGTKVVVTPGMIELGAKEKELNKEFGKQIAKVADYVILVGEKRTIPIKEGLLEEKYDEKKIHVLNDVREAYTLIKELKDKKEMYALFENDLPDTYTE